MSEDKDQVVLIPVLSAEEQQRVKNREARQKQLAENYPTLRDQFAMTALGGVLANPGVQQTHEVLAQMAYELAEAMLKERAK